MTYRKVDLPESVFAYFDREAGMKANVETVYKRLLEAAEVYGNVNVLLAKHEEEVAVTTGFRRDDMIWGDVDTLYCNPKGLDHALVEWPHLKTIFVHGDPREEFGRLVDVGQHNADEAAHWFDRWQAATSTLRRYRGP